MQEFILVCKSHVSLPKCVAHEKFMHANATIYKHFRESLQMIRDKRKISLLIIEKSCVFEIVA